MKAKSSSTTLKRAGNSTDEISEMLGHRNTIVTQRYLASLDMEKLLKSMIICIKNTQDL